LEIQEVSHPSFPGPVRADGALAARHSEASKTKNIDWTTEMATLRRLWAEQQRYDPDAESQYLGAHFAMDLTMERHQRAVDMIFPYISGKVLEWGCLHAADSCIYRMRLGDAVDLYGCDVVPDGRFKPFHDFSGIKYSSLNHPYRLDYDDGFFDVVTSMGVLEHVPEDRNSVGEIYKKLKPGGVFALTCLPNRFSYTEATSRWRGGAAHDRLYTIGSTTRMLNEAGFEVDRTRYFFMVPTMLNGFPQRMKNAYARAHKPLWALNDALEMIWPINRLASNLMFIARKPIKR
jgi:SAM-dependent methyltransferase